MRMSNRSHCFKNFDVLNTTLTGLKTKTHQIIIDPILPNNLQQSIFHSLINLHLHIILFALLVLSAIIYHFVLTNWTRTARLVNKFPGKKIFPLVGTFYEITSPPDWQKQLSNLGQKYGPIFRSWIGYKPIIFVADGQIAQKVLSGFDAIEKGDKYVAFHSVFGQGLVTAPGYKWKQDKKTLNPAFAFKYWSTFLQSFNTQSTTLVRILEEMYKSPINQCNGTNILPTLTRCTLDSVFEAVFESNPDTQNKPEQQFAETIYGLNRCARLKGFRPYLHFPIIWHLFGLGFQEDNLISQLIPFILSKIDATFRQRMMTNTDDATGHKPFVSFLMDAHLSREDIAFHVNTLCLAGSETSASAINYILFLLALNPPCQANLVQEVDTVCRIQNDDDEGIIDLGQLTKLKYMEMCIKEGMRIYPPVPAMIRKITKDIPLDDNRILPLGTEVALLPFDIHRNPEIYPNPEVFLPERFNLQDPNYKPIPNGSYLAFSYGPRNCIGHRYAMLQMKTMLAHIFSKFTVHTTQKRDDIRVIYGAVLEPSPGIRLILHKRTS